MQVSWKDTKSIENSFTGSLFLQTKFSFGLVPEDSCTTFGTENYLQCFFGKKHQNHTATGLDIDAWTFYVNSNSDEFFGQLLDDGTDKQVGKISKPSGRRVFLRNGLVQNSFIHFVSIGHPLYCLENGFGLPNTWQMWSKHQKCSWSTRKLQNEFGLPKNVKINLVEQNTVKLIR